MAIPQNTGLSDPYRLLEIFKKDNTQISMLEMKICKIIKRMEEIHCIPLVYNADIDSIHVHLPTCSREYSKRVIFVPDLGKIMAPHFAGV